MAQPVMIRLLVVSLFGSSIIVLRRLGDVLVVHTAAFGEIFWIPYCNFYCALLFCAVI